MSSVDQADPSAEIVTTVIGFGAHFKGEFTLTGALRIDGTFEGRIDSASKVIVGESGLVRTNIIANKVVVAGTVEGNIYAPEEVHLLATAKVTGDIVSGNLIMEPGVIFEGRAKINKI
ncbi:MAG: polymer-forming cytoskeletal family protein [Candidatus Hydrogenedentota bacterium]|nr:MAG: polymer-forming cytoskeletal family protein [Candidatus Hydrogenedentota bacterium]